MGFYHLAESVTVLCSQEPLDEGRTADFVLASRAGGGGGGDLSNLFVRGKVLGGLDFFELDLTCLGPGLALVFRWDYDIFF